uniref:Protein FAM32A n=1 Tax=Arcella intermedia TaxID=1963864 RepID=A0A6B2LPE6_9EUKA
MSSKPGRLVLKGGVVPKREKLEKSKSKSKAKDKEKKSKKDKEREKDNEDNSREKVEKAEKKRKRSEEDQSLKAKRQRTEEDKEKDDDWRTPSEKAFDLVQAQRKQIRIAKAVQKSHRQKVEEFNTKLANLSEHYDIPKVGPG